MSASKKQTVVVGGTEEVTKVYTPFTMRSKELRNAYNELTLPYPTVEERLETLSKIKLIVQEFDCILTRQVIEIEFKS
jgi:hypothetical protein